MESVNDAGSTVIHELTNDRHFVFVVFGIRRTVVDLQREGMGSNTVALRVDEVSKLLTHILRNAVNLTEVGKDLHFVEIDFHNAIVCLY